MTYSILSCDDSRSLIRAAVSVFFAAATVGMLGACDSTDPRPENVSDRSPSTPEVNVETESVQQIDLQFEPVSLAPGETFTIELADNQHERSVTRILHEGTPNGKTAVKAKFAPLHPNSVAVRCRNVITGAEQTMTTLTSTEFDLDSVMQPVAMTEDEPDSYHYIDNGETVIVSVDYDDDDDGDANSQSTAPGPSFDFSSSDQSVQCTHVSFVLSGVTTSLSPRGVQFGGDVETPAIESKKVR